MPPESADFVGALKADLSISATAMPSAFAEIAVFIAVTIWATFEVSDPVHWYVHFTSAQASWMPYWVAWKNGFVVTWLTKTNLYFGVVGNCPAPLGVAAAALPSPPLLPPPQAARNAAAAVVR